MYTRSTHEDQRRCGILWWHSLDRMKDFLILENHIISSDSSEGYALDWTQPGLGWFFGSLSIPGFGSLVPRVVLKPIEHVLLLPQTLPRCLTVLILEYI